MKNLSFSFEASRIEGMLEVLERLAGGETQLRIPLSDSRDHLDALAYGVNAIAQELVYLKEAAEAANQAKTQFLAMMSHEIRTPLSSILGLCELLKTVDLSGAEKDGFLKRIQCSGQLLRGIVDNVLDLSKVESGQFQMERHWLSPKETLLEVIDGLEHSAHKKGIELLWEVDSEVPDRMAADPLRFRQILTNIISNGIKFTSQGHVSVQMKCVVSRESPHLEIRVTDTGIGIDESKQKFLFHPFQQADQATSRCFGGTGLGLMLARSFARLMGGDIVLTQSLPGKGSVFQISLPIGSPDFFTGQVGVERLGQGLPDKSGNRLQGLRILVGEDCKELRFLYDQFLVNEGAVVTMAANGEEVLLLSKNQDFDLLLIDVNMPKLNGIEATQQLRTRGFKQPIVALTADIMNNRAEQCRAAGFTTTVYKPFGFDELIHTLGRIVREG